MRLEQGDKFVQDYYGELQKGLMRCSVVEGNEDAICRFYSGLRREIQDIVDYKEFNTVNQLFQFAMLAKKELQGHDTAEQEQGQHHIHATLSTIFGANQANHFLSASTSEQATNSLWSFCYT